MAQTVLTYNAHICIHKEGLGMQVYVAVNPHYMTLLSKCVCLSALLLLLNFQFWVVICKVTVEVK